MNVNTLGNLQQNIVSTDLIERLEAMIDEDGWLIDRLSSEQVETLQATIAALREQDKDKIAIGRSVQKMVREWEAESKTLQARIEELEKCMETPRIEDLEKIEQYEKLLLKRTHMCSGRDCVGIYQETTGSLPRCDDCTELKRIMGEGNVV